MQRSRLQRTPPPGDFGSSKATGRYYILQLAAEKKHKMYGSVKLKLRGKHMEKIMHHLHRDSFNHNKMKINHLHLQKLQKQGK